MAQFDESKVINVLHPEKAVVGKKYWYSDNIKLLKHRVEQNNSFFVGKLVHISDSNTIGIFYNGNGYWEYLYPYEDSSEQGMTNRQLTEWLAKGNGQWKYKTKGEMSVCTEYIYNEGKENVRPKNIVIRPFGTDEWIKPTVAIYERDCKE